MRVTQNGDVFIATRITGPTHNFLALDFSSEEGLYIRDVSDSDSVAESMIASIERQVQEAFESLDVDIAELAGIRFDARDTPSETLYVELATRILESREPEAL